MLDTDTRGWKPGALIAAQLALILIASVAGTVLLFMVTR